MKKLSFITCICLILSLFTSVNIYAKEPPKSTESVNKAVAIEKDIEAPKKAVSKVYGAKDLSYWNKFSSDFFYDRMNYSEKQLYSSLKQVSDKYLTTNVDGIGEETEFKDQDGLPYTKTVYTTNAVPYSGMSSDRAMEIYIIFANANPQFYFLNSYILFTSTNIYPVLYDQYADGNSRAAYTEKFSQKIDSWLTEVNAASTLYDKERAIISVLCRDLSYAKGDWNPHQSTATAVFDGVTVCAGYAECFTMLCSAIGIPNFINTSEEHEWACVKLGEYWYNVDVTNIDSTSGNYRWQYANKSDATFAGLHSTYYILENIYYTLGRPKCLYDYGSEPVILQYTMYRLYNPKTTEHLYTADENEKNYLSKTPNWNYEGIAWSAPANSEKPVYRLYNTRTNEHHYTADANERRYLLTQTHWNDEGIGWYSAGNDGTPLYRVFNPKATVGSHHYTADKNEYKYLTTHGWNDEGIGWYGL